MNPIWYIIVPIAIIGLAIYFIRKTERDRGNHASSSTQNALNGLYLDIYNHCAQYIHDYENKHGACGLTTYLPKIQLFLERYGNEPDEGNADQIALTVLWNFTSDALKCGTYHFHIGSLTPQGLAIKQFAEFCVDHSLKKEYISSQDAQEALKSLYDSIRDAG